MEAMRSMHRILAGALMVGVLVAPATTPAAEALPQRCDTQVEPGKQAAACEWRKTWGDVALVVGTPYFQYDADAPSQGADFVFGYEWDVPGESLRSYWGRSGDRKFYNGRLELGPRGAIQMKNEAGAVVGTGRVDPDGATALTQDGNTNRILLQADGAIANAWTRGSGRHKESGTVYYFPATREGRALAAARASAGSGEG